MLITLRSMLFMNIAILLDVHIFSPWIYLFFLSSRDSGTYRENKVKSLFLTHFFRYRIKYI